MSKISLNELNTVAKENFHNNLENGLSENAALQNSVDIIVEKISNLDLPVDFINECSELIHTYYNNAMNDGQSPTEALNSAVEKLYQNIESENDSNSISNSNINLDFAITGDSPRLDLMNEAMAKGLSVEESIKYVNSKLNENSNEFGPPTLSEFNKVNESMTQTADVNENQEINMMEATMDAEANKKVIEETVTDKLNIDDKKFLNESNFDNKEDEVS